MNAALTAAQFPVTWPFETSFRNALCKTDYATGGVHRSNEKKSKMIHAEMALACLQDLGDQRCWQCGGHGHSNKVCPTGPRLTTIMSFSPVAKNKLAQARFAQKVENAHHLDAEKPLRKQYLPYKRRRSRADRGLAYSEY